MPKFGSTAGRTAPKVAGTGAGGFLKQPALVGELVIAIPVEEKLGKWHEGEPDERETRQLTADVIVLTGPNKGQYPGMFLSGKPIVDKGVEILASGEDMVLAGRMTRKPLKQYKDHWKTPAELEIAIADPKVVVPNNAYSWLIPDASPDDLKLVMAYYENGAQAPAGDDEESDPDVDPFEDD